MTRDGLTEENLRDGSVKDISHRSRGRPENKEEFVPERERKKAENEDSKSGKGKRLQMEKIRKSSVRQEAVEDTVEVTPEEKVSGYQKKLHRHEKIPDDDNNLNSQKKSIRKKQLQKQMTKEQAKAGRLSFDDEGNQMVKGAGMKPGGTAGKYIATQAVISGMKAVTSEEEETDENAGVESARLAERETEAALRGLRHAQIRSKRTDVKTHRKGYREATVEKKLKFGSAESMEGVKHAESVKNAEQKRHFYNRFFQKKRYKDAYRAARAGKSAGSLGGATTIAGVENIALWHLPYQEARQQNVSITVENYRLVSIHEMQENEKVADIWKRTKNQCEVSDVLVLNKNGEISCYYVDENYPQYLAGFIRINTSGALITMETENYQIDGKKGNWIATDTIIIDGKQFYLMEHQVYRDQAQGVILDAYGKMVVEECKKFDEKTKQKIHDYIQQQVPLNLVEQLKQDGKIRLEHYQKFYQNGTYERSRESGTEANYDMVDGLVNNQKKNQEKTSDASSNNQTSRNQQDGKPKKRRSVIKRLHQKQIAIARRSGKPIPKYLDQEMERKRG